MSIGKWWNLIAGYAANQLAKEAPREVAVNAAAVCAGCDDALSFTEDEIWAELPLGSKLLFDAPPMSVWCGQPGVEMPGRRCGCLVLAETEKHTPLTFRGRTVEPAGKTLKDGFHCPQGKW